MSYPDLKTEAQYKQELATCWKIIEQDKEEITRLRAALTRIAYLQMDICSPPLRSVEETMRLIAKDALNPPVEKGKEAQG